MFECCGAWALPSTTQTGWIWALRELDSGGAACSAGRQALDPSRPQAGLHHCQHWCALPRSTLGQCSQGGLQRTLPRVRCAGCSAGSAPRGVRADAPAQRGIYEAGALLAAWLGVLLSSACPRARPGPGRTLSRMRCWHMPQGVESCTSALRSRPCIERRCAQATAWPGGRTAC